jgi:hypothetical protein
MKLNRLFLAMLLPLAGCDLSGLTSIVAPDAPTNLTYQLIPSGDPNAPLGVLLTWDIPSSGRVIAFNVYGRVTGGDWQLRATTTSPTFHDAGTPDAQYYVASRDENGNELANSNTLTIDMQARLPAPQNLSSISLNTAIQLTWNPNAVNASPSTFDHYLVYSTAYDTSRGVCTANWVEEGSTVSDGFLVGNLTNGTTRCFSVSAVTHDGHESVWSGARIDTPRYDARNAFAYARQTRPDSAGFLFLDETNKKIGTVAPATRADLDFTIERHADGTLWFAPGRAGVTLGLYSSTPVPDLTSVDRAPSSGLSSVTIQAVPGFAYVFQIQKSDGVHYAAVRVAFVTLDYVVFDWSYQSAPGNAELSVVPHR